MAMQIVETLRSVPDALRDEDRARQITSELKALARAWLGRASDREHDLPGAMEAAWKSVASALTDRQAQEGSASSAQLDVGVMLSRLSRNMLAGVQRNKAVLMPSEPLIRQLCIGVTAFDKLDDSKYLPLQKALYQLLSNLFACSGEGDQPNAAAGSWAMYMSGQRDAEVIHRALESHDAGWNLACLMLVLQAIRASPAGVRPLLSEAGTRLVQHIADKMPGWHAAEEGTDDERCFGIACEIFGEVFAHEVQGDLYERLARPHAPVSAAQVMLLKVLDGHLAASSSPSSSPGAPGPSSLASPKPNSFLVPAFLRAGAHIQRQAPRLSTTSNSATLEEMDLPRAFEGIMLASQCLIHLCLAETEAEQDRADAHVRQEQEDIRRRARIERADEEGVPEIAVGLLYTLDKLIPRVKPYRQPAPSDASTSPQPDEAGVIELEPFARLKRELVQLVGVLAHDDADIQNRVRERGGVEMILSMCVVDERNPYIREHALLAVRNLMMGNLANQAVIKEMNPIGVVGEDGVLQEMPERLGLRREKVARGER